MKVILLLPFAASLGNGIAQTPLSLNLNSVNDISGKEISERNYEIISTGKDPFVLANPLKKALPQTNTVLAFEYFCPTGLDHLHVFFSSEIDKIHSKLLRNVPVSEAWSLFTIDLSDVMEDWGKPGNILRLDFGGKANVALHIRNLILRDQTERLSGRWHLYINSE